MGPRKISPCTRKSPFKSNPISSREKVCIHQPWARKIKKTMICDRLETEMKELESNENGRETEKTIVKNILRVNPQLFVKTRMILCNFVFTD